ncbi:DNA cytosine methyltransferase [Pseudomonas syringae]|uniref:DNA cytosine methyltransferase n=1 Tax=Pseudomonas syringae TaxID=317 RepID=UPI002E11784A|nr:DNA cytosine methyltransferase [Pseudomonas syringae]
MRAGTGSDRGSYQAVRPLHPVENRVITPRECARRQGFPDDFIFHPTAWHSCRMIGNSVSPIIAEALLKNIHSFCNRSSGEEKKKTQKFPANSKHRSYIS